MRLSTRVHRGDGPPSRALMLVLLVCLLVCLAGAVAAVRPAPAAADDPYVYGTIEGTVTDASTGAPLWGVAVEANAWDPEKQQYTLYCGAVWTDVAGHYSFELPVHDHLILCISKPFYTTQYWNGVATRDEADPVVVVPGVTTPGYDVQLQEAANGWVSGHLTDDRTGQRLHGGGIYVYQKSGDAWVRIDNATADQDGAYSLHLLAGEYRLQFLGYPYYDTYFPDGRAFDQAETIEVRDGDSITADVSLHEVPPSFSGQIQDLDHHLLGDITVDVLDADTGAVLASGKSDAYGGFCVTSDPWTSAGRYKLRFSDPSGAMQTEYYSDAADLASATVLAPAHSYRPEYMCGAVHLDAVAPARIHGTVRNSGGEALQGMTVHVAVLTNSSYAYSTTTDASGSYDLSLPVGKYRDYAVWCTDESGGYLVAYMGGVDSVWHETELHATPGSSAEVDLVMHRSCTIRGTVTEEGTGGPAGPVYVCARDLDGNWLPDACSDWNGVYSIAGVPDGTYHLWVFDPFGRWISRWWPDADDESGAQTVTVSVGAEDIVVDCQLTLDGTQPVTDALADVTAVAGRAASFAFTVDDTRGAEATTTIAIMKKGAVIKKVAAGKRAMNKRATFRWRVRGLRSGRYTWKVYATDPAGNHQARATAKRLVIR